MLFLACFKVGGYLVPKINLFYALKYKYFINQCEKITNKSWVIDGTTIVK